jgi:hypothetical protein
MHSTLFDDVFATLKTMRLSATDVARIQIWIADREHQAASTPLAEAAARERERGAAMCTRGHATMRRD